MEQSNLPNSLQDDEQGEDTGIKAKFGQVPEELIRDLTISDGAIRFYAYLSWYCSESDDIDWRSLPFALLLYAFLKRDDQEAWWNQMRLHLKELEDNDWVAVGLDIRDDGQQVEFIQVFDNQAECKKWREAQEQERAFSIFRWMEKGPKPGFVYLL